MRQNMLISERYVTFRCDPTKSAVCVNFIDEEARCIVEQVFVQLGEGDGRRTFVDMEEFVGRTLAVELWPCKSEWGSYPEGELDEETAESRRRFIACEADYTDAAHYSEPHRPLYHFTTARGWINDPNGCIYYDGLWHLYYQHCPGSTDSMWDNNHWGHATSPDLFCWTERQPVLRFPHQASGTGFIDRESCRACVTTGNLIFESPDGGFTYKFKSYNTAGCGDPKIFWHEESGRYIAITLRDITSYSIASSPDLVEWRHESDVEGYRECPEFCRYRIEGTDEYKWVLNGGDGAYRIGDFDGHEFKPDPLEPDRPDKYVHLMEATRNFTEKYNGIFIDSTLPDTENRYTAYAHQNFDNAPDGRHVRIAWYTVDFHKYGELFTQAMTVPQELSLRRRPVGLRLCAMPVDEIKAHYGETRTARGENPSVAFEGGTAFDLTATLEQSGALAVGGYTITYSAADRALTVSGYGRSFPVPFVAGSEKLRVRALFDTFCAEFFFGDGEVYLPLKPYSEAQGITASATGPATLTLSTVVRTVK